MTVSTKGGTFPLGERIVNRMGYGAMQLAGPGVFGPPRDRAEAMAVLRGAMEAGVNNIDTSDFYGPHITKQIMSEALHPYRTEEQKSELQSLMSNTYAGYSVKKKRKSKVKRKRYKADR